MSCLLSKSDGGQSKTRSNTCAHISACEGLTTTFIVLREIGTCESFIDTLINSPLDSSSLTHDFIVMQTLICI